MATPHDEYADVVINDKIGDVLPLIVGQVKARMMNSP